MVYRPRPLLTGVLLAFSALVPARADVLDDQTVYSDYSYPALAAVAADLGSQSMPWESDYSAAGGYSDVVSFFELDLGDSSTTAFNVREPDPFVPADFTDFGGIGVNDAVSNFSTPVTMDSMTYLDTFVSLPMPYRNDQIYASWQILGLTQNSNLQFDPGASDIPEPASALLVAGALAGLLLRRKFAR